jgi:indolepyruvate ferredoxin oxidoreductase alpha subunit
VAAPPDAGKQLLYGNEAIARGAWEAGVRVATGYPGTPSTEIIETMAAFEDVYVEWSPNEKVALEVATGASLGGARAMASMKHVGVNVAADPLLTAAYMGVNAGLVLVSADDPGMHSSQNEQDNRWYGKFAHLPVLEPADSQEAKDFTIAAFALSEEFDTPVILRSTTRISHARSLVELAARARPPARPYRKDPLKNVMLPAHARMRKPVIESRIRLLSRYAETCPFNRTEWPAASGDGERARPPRGFVTGGIAYQYVREAFPDAPVFKLGLSYPLPFAALSSFATRVERLYVVEELDAFWETELSLAGLQPVGKPVFPAAGELSAAIVRRAVLDHEAGIPKVPIPPPDEPGVPAVPPEPRPAALPMRPPVLCAGCPHRAVFHVLRKLRLTVTGDIGCYTLGALAPLAAMDTCTCMGASIGQSIGMRRAMPPEDAARVVAVIGDSTFIHSGITPLIDAAYNRTGTAVVIMDNGTTAMTGHQGHPASGWDARRQESPRLQIERLAEACGARSVRVVDPLDLDALEGAVREALAPGDGPAVVIARRPCVLLGRGATGRAAAVEVNADLCTECGVCLRLGCPAIARSGRKPEILPGQCTGCGLCPAVCPAGAMSLPPAAGPKGGGIP